jgi:hypothetical protein
MIRMRLKRRKKIFLRLYKIMSAPPKNTLNKDLKHGLQKETERVQDFEKVFGSLTKTTQYYNFDWVNTKKHFYVEHKERNIDFGRFDSLFFDKVKYDRYLEIKKENPFARCFIIWTCNNVPYIWEFADQFDDDDIPCFYFSRREMDRRRGHGWQPQELVNVFNEACVPFQDFKLY